jgi:hypothetical protein
MSSSSKVRKIKHLLIANRLALGFLFLVPIVAVVGQQKLRFSQNTLANGFPEVLALQPFASSIGETLPSAYAETPAGLSLISPKYGASKPELNFLHRFRRPIILSSQYDFDDVDAEKIKKDLQRQLLNDFARDRAYVQDWLPLTDQQAKVAYAVLRTNGSIPTYQVRSYVPNDLKSLLLSSSGNCSDYTIRLMMVLEAIGVKAMFVSIVTEQFPGHVVVDAYDPEEDTSYILDANYNTMLIRPNSQGKGFLEQVFREQSAKFIDGIEIISFPVYFSSVANESSSIPLNVINGQRDEMTARWKRWIENDRDELLSWWMNTPTHRPATLAELRQVTNDGIPVLDNIPQDFSASGSYANNLREYLGIQRLDVRQ